MSTGTVSCPSCGATNRRGGFYCVICGKELQKAGEVPAAVVPPAMAWVGVEVERGKREVQMRQDLHRGSGALLAVAMLNTAFFVAYCCIMFGGAREALAGFFADQQSREVMSAALPNFKAILEAEWSRLWLVVARPGCVALLFWGLYAWSLRRALPAAVVGLVSHLSIWIVTVLIDPTRIRNGVVAKAVIASLLVRAIFAAMEEAKMMRSWEARNRAAPSHDVTSHRVDS